MSLGRTLPVTALIAGLAALPSAAHGAAQETAPCTKLAAREVRFSAGDAGRVVFVTATDFNRNAVLITGCLRDADRYVPEWQVAGFIGENGFAPEGTLRDGQYRSPTGSFSATEAIGLADPGTKLSYHQVNPGSRWGGPGSPSYNDYPEGGSAADENLWYWANQGTYAQAAVINTTACRTPFPYPVPTTRSSSARGTEPNSPGLIPLGALLVAFGGTALFIALVLRRHEKGRLVETVLGRIRRLHGNGRPQTY